MWLRDTRTDDFSFPPAHGLVMGFVVGCLHQVFMGGDRRLTVMHPAVCAPATHVAAGDHSINGVSAALP